MKELTIEISIDELGELTAETFGFKGKVCETELRELLKDDFVIGDFDKKEDYYKKEESEAIFLEKLKGLKK